MFFEVFKQLKIAVMLLLCMSLVTGILYPLAVTGVAQLFFNWRANGSLIEENGKVIGSSLIGQGFTDDNYFTSRPSATTPFPYNAINSSGSNLGPSNPDLFKQVSARVIELNKHNPGNHLIPVDLVTASGSGLDPDISPQAAYYQAARIAKIRGVNIKTINDLIKQFTHAHVLGFFGEPHVNVLRINIALDKLTQQKDNKLGAAS